MPLSRRLQHGYAVCGLTTALLLVLAGAPASEAAPSSLPLTTLPHAAQKLTAYDGYVVFSQYEPSARDWRLMVWHGGSVKRLPVSARGVPFDANVGPAANGRPAVVYSRCRYEPPPPLGFELEKSEEHETGWARAGGCRIYELSLPGGSPALVSGIGVPGTSDTTPAIWNGDIAFGRLVARSHVARIYLWRHSDHRLVRLGGGPGPVCRLAKAVHQAGKVAPLLPGLAVPYRNPCQSNAGGPLSAWVAGMSLDGGALAYQWFAEDSGPLFGVEAAQPQIRIDPLRGGRQSGPGRVAQTSFVSGTCGSVAGGSPNAVGNSVLYSRIDAECGRGGWKVSSSFTAYAAEANTWRSAHAGGGLIAAVAQDHGTTYWISDVPRQEPPLGGVSPCAAVAANVVCSPRADENTSDCDPAHGTCTLMQTTGLVFGAPRHRPPRGPA